MDNKISPPRFKHNPYQNSKEVAILREIGLADEEISYLTWLKMKKMRSLKWKKA